MCLACGFSPYSGPLQEPTDQCFFFSSILLSLSLSIPSPLSKINKYVLGWGLKKLSTPIFWCPRGRKYILLSCFWVMASFLDWCRTQAETGRENTPSKNILNQRVKKSSRQYSTAAISRIVQLMLKCQQVTRATAWLLHGLNALVAWYPTTTKEPLAFSRFVSP